MSDTPDPSPERLLRFLRSVAGDAVRSLVRYDGDEATVHYVRQDIDGSFARLRLERVAELYASERAVATATPDDPDFGRLHASVHVFGAAVVVHLLTPTGAAFGFSLEHHTGGDLVGFVRDCAEALYGDVPDDLTIL
jgi:hypothetical protein